MTSGGRRLAAHRGPGSGPPSPTASRCAGLRASGLAAAAATEPKPRPDGDIHWDEVVAVTPAGIQQVWDLTVDGPTASWPTTSWSTTPRPPCWRPPRWPGRCDPGASGVALVDANTAQSSVATILQRPVRGSVLDLVRTDVDEALLAQALTPVPEAGDLDVLFGAPDLRSTDERLLTPALWRRIVATLRRTHDYVIVDTPVAEAVGHELFDDFVLRDSTGPAGGARPQPGDDPQQRRVARHHRRPGERRRPQLPARPGGHRAQPGRPPAGVERAQRGRPLPPLPLPGRHPPQRGGAAGGRRRPAGAAVRPHRGPGRPDDAGGAGGRAAAHRAGHRAAGGGSGLDRLLERLFGRRSS